MGRRAHQPDPGQRRQVEALAAYGIPEEDISRVVAIDPKTLRKHYREELDLGQTKANAQVAGFLFNSARNGNVTAQIFWLKTRAQWKETPSEHRHVAAVGTFDVRAMSDEELERRIFGKPIELPGLSRLERSEVLAPVLDAMLNATKARKDEEAGGY
jgi:hypothetical protein